MKRVLALDIGSVRIGVAVSDPLGMFAQGIAVLEANSRGEDGWLEELDRLVAVYSPGAILLGNPVRTDGRKGPESLRVEAWAERISARYPAISVKLHDERFSPSWRSRLFWKRTCRGRTGNGTWTGWQRH